MAMREQRDIARGGTRPGDHPVYPRTHLLRRLAARASVSEDQPARRGLVDLPGCQTLVLAVVPTSWRGLPLVIETDGAIDSPLEETGFEPLVPPHDERVPLVKGDAPER